MELNVETISLKALIVKEMNKGDFHRDNRVIMEGNKEISRLQAEKIRIVKELSEGVKK